MKRPADKSKPVTTGQTSRYHPIENAIYEAAEGRRAGYSTPCFLAGKAVDKQAEGK